MNTNSKILLFGIAFFAAGLSVTSTSAQVPSAILPLREATIAAVFHAEGIQLYECMRGRERALAWQIREPIATLIFDGTTVGRHYSGPTWEHVDGSIVRARVTGSAPGATPNDIPWLKLDATSQRGNGILSNVTTVQRVNTSGGMAQGSCDEAGSFHSVPYSADYIFLRAD